MIRIPSAALPFLLVLPLCACLENEEHIEIGADGSVEVQVSARGMVNDLADGYPVPLDGVWQPVGAATELWLREVGPTTGGAWTSGRAAEVDWAALGFDPEKLELGARARFASVEAWPRFFAPENEVYREAYSERSASLRVERRGRFTVYSFERTYHARKNAGYNLLHTLFQSAVDWPEDLSARLEENQPLVPEDWPFIARELEQVFASVYHNFAADALRVEDDGPYPRAFAARVTDEVSAQIAGLVTQERLMKVLAEMRVLEEAGEPAGAPLLALEQDARELLRESLRARLVAAALPDDVVYTVLGRVEFGLTSADHSAELGGEKFRVEVKLPGTIVSGNHDALKADRAHWQFDTAAFTDRDFTLRVVSIVE